VKRKLKQKRVANEASFGSALLPKVLNAYFEKQYSSHVFSKRTDSFEAILVFSTYESLVSAFLEGSLFSTYI